MKNYSLLQILERTIFWAGFIALTVVGAILIIQSFTIGQNLIFKL